MQKKKKKIPSAYAEIPKRCISPRPKHHDVAFWGSTVSASCLVGTEIPLLVTKGRVGKVEGYSVEINSAARGTAPSVLMSTTSPKLSFCGFPEGLFLNGTPEEDT